VLSDWLNAFHEGTRETSRVAEYRTGAAALILKHGHLPPPLEALVRMFEIDWDWLNEEIAAALSATGDPSTLGLLLEKYGGLPWSAWLRARVVAARSSRNAAADESSARNHCTRKRRPSLSHRRTPA